MDKNLNEQIGDIIVQYRARKRMTQEQLATDIGCTRGFISDVERGERSVSIETLARISRATGLKPNKLLGL